MCIRHIPLVWPPRVGARCAQLAASRNLRSTNVCWLFLKSLQLFVVSYFRKVILLLVRGSNLSKHSYLSQSAWATKRRCFSDFESVMQARGIYFGHLIGSKFPGTEEGTSSFLEVLPGMNKFPRVSVQTPWSGQTHSRVIYLPLIECEMGE